MIAVRPVPYQAFDSGLPEHIRKTNLIPVGELAYLLPPKFHRFRYITILATSKDHCIFSQAVPLRNTFIPIVCDLFLEPVQVSIRFDLSKRPAGLCLLEDVVSPGMLEETDARPR